jgi:transcriptional regulator with XRE-family HTH domain
MKTRIDKLAGFLRTARETKGLSLRAVEKMTGISNAYLSQLESDKVQQPSPVKLNTLCEVYKISYAEAMELAGYPIPNPALREEPTSYSRFASRVGSVTEEEEDALVEYLEFLRSRQKKGRRQ